MRRRDDPNLWFVEQFIEQLNSAMSPQVTNNAVNTHDEGDKLVITVDVPGFTKEDISIGYENGAIHIEAEATDDGKHRTNRPRFDHHIPLPKDKRFEFENASARYKNGVLTIELPKNEEDTKDNNIPIEG